MRVDADLDLLDPKLAHAAGLSFADHHAVRLYFDIEKALPRMLNNVEKIAAHQYFAATQREEENAGICKLIKNVLNLGSGHLPKIVMIQVTVDAAFVASVS